jgi:hypothetical protein
VKSLRFTPEDYDDGNVNGPWPATAAAGAAAVPGYVNSGTLHKRRGPSGPAGIFVARDCHTAASAAAPNACRFEARASTEDIATP